MASNLCGNCKRTLDGARTCPNCGWAWPAARPRTARSNTTVLVFAIGAAVLVAGAPFFYGVYQGFREHRDAERERLEVLAEERNQLRREHRLEKRDAETAASAPVHARSETRAATNGAELLRGLDAIEREEAMLAEQARSPLYAEFDELQLDGFLGPQQLADARSVADGRTRARRYRELVGGLTRIREKKYDAIERRLRILAGDMSTGQVMLRRFETSRREIGAIESQVDDNRQVMADAYEAIFDFAASRQGRMTIENGELTFYEQADTDAYLHSLAILKGAKNLERALAQRLRTKIAEMNGGGAR